MPGGAALSLVAITKTDGLPDVPQLMLHIEQLLEPFGGMANFVFPGAKVLVKPNVGCLAKADSSLVTHPAVTEAVVRLVQQAGAKEVWIAESCIIGSSTEEAFDLAGYRAVAAAAHVPLIDLKKENFVDVTVPQPLQLSQIAVFERALAADVIINVPKLKTIVATPVSIGVKNLKGLIADKDKKRCHHTYLNRAIVDIYQILKPQLTIVDAIIGSSLYQPISHNILLAGTDTVAVDTVACITASVDPRTVEYLMLAQSYGFGLADPNQIYISGEDPYAVQQEYQQAATDVEAYATLYPQVKVVAGAACSGCVNTVELVLRNAEKMAALEKWRDKLVIAIGPEAPLEHPGKTVLCLGNCLAKRAGQRPFLPGCPCIGVEGALWLKEHEPHV